jgi:hypothetical protein
MLAAIVSEMLFERQGFLIMLRVENPLLLSVIDSLGFNGLLSISIRRMKTGREYYEVMRLGSIGIGIQRRMLHVRLAKNRTLLALLNAINDAKDGCFRVVFIGILRGLVSFGRKNGGLLTQKDIKRKLSLLLQVGFDSTEMLGLSLLLCRILRLLTGLRRLWRSSMNEAFIVSNGLRFLQT